MRWFESSHPSNTAYRVTHAYLDAMLQAFIEQDLVRASQCFAVDGVYRELRREPIQGREAIAAHFAAFSASGIAWQFTLDDVIAAADRACVVYRFVMAEGQGRPRRERAGCAVVRLDVRGRIAEWREYEG
jgi:limonene-1,2-epoxide hydrolase